MYVERREGADLAARAIEGRGKRAASATAYAPLHFLTAHHALSQMAAARLGTVRVVHDLGCGTGAAGAAAALSFDARPRVCGIDRSGFLLAEARRTWASFGLAARARRGRLPEALPRPARGELWVLGWAVNELGERARDALLERVTAALAVGAALLLLEPLAGPMTPWWPDWVRALAPHGVEERLLKVHVALPEWLARLDKAAGLDHRVLGARVLAGPLDPGTGDA